MRAWVALSLVVVVTAALTEEPVNRGVQTSRGLALEQEREHGGPEGAGGVLRKRKEGTGTVQKTQKEEQGKRSRGMKKVCPGRCVDGPRQCVRGRTVRSSRCGKQVCCITGTKKTRQRKNRQNVGGKNKRIRKSSKNTRQDADGDNSEIERKRNRCSPRRACRKLKGKCQQDGRKCPPGTQPYQNTKQTRYCKKKNCVCCAKAGDGCTTKSKCSDKKGYCTKDPKRCEGRFKKSKNFCSGADCVCCLPSKPCKTKYECEDYGGECINLETGHCYTEPLVGKKYCKGRNCGCCVPEATTTTTRRPHVTPPRPHFTTPRPHFTTTRPHFTPRPPHFTTTRPHFTTTRPHFTTTRPHFPTTTTTTTRPHATNPTTKPAKKMGWSYNGDTGPDSWHKITPKCSGQRQSPIDLSVSEMQRVEMEPFKFYNFDNLPDSMELMNNGHTVVLVYHFKDMPRVTGGGLNGTYEFRQLHCHWGKTPSEGSEHFINHHGYPFEIHLVHFKTDYGGIMEALKHEDGLAVLGVLVKEGNKVHSLLAKIAAAAAQIVDPKTTTPFKPTALYEFLPRNLTMFCRYKGSLTTPPCLELVVWTVFNDTLSTTMESLDPLRTMLMDVHHTPLTHNHRPLQTMSALHEPVLGHTSASYHGFRGHDGGHY